MNSASLSSPGPAGERLRQRRLRAGLSLRQLATETRISKTYLSQIERGERTPWDLIRSINVVLDGLVDRKAEIAEAQAEIAAAADMLAEYIGRVPETITDADDDADQGVVLYPADVAALLARIGMGRPALESLSGPFTYDHLAVTR